MVSVLHANIAKYENTIKLSLICFYLVYVNLDMKVTNTPHKAKVIGIIPARYHSTRLPGKLLLDLCGKSVLQRVYENAGLSRSMDQVIIATDHPLIFQHCNEHQMSCVMTDEAHQSGTDRCAEAALQFSDTDYVINLQGDEPFLLPAEIDTFVEDLISREADIATLACPFQSESQLSDPSKVKVVFGQHGKALYFSRSIIPYVRNKAQDQWIKEAAHFRHVGIYAFRYSVLQALTKLPMGTLERLESLEQLRWLEHGYSIHVHCGSYEGEGIDTEEDYQKALTRLRSDITTME